MVIRAIRACRRSLRVRIAFQRANPRSHNESLLLRVDSLGEPTQCLLFDAGRGVDLDELLGDDDVFLGTCLSHAHSDHYDALDAVQAAARRRENADPTVYTGTDTAAILDDVLDVAATERSDGHGEGRDEPTGEAVRAVDGWLRLSELVELRPVAAGHAPGAAGFLVRIDDGSDERLCLVTGDWTLRDAGGTPGLPVEELPQVDVLFLTTATATGVPETFTDVVGTALERASAGAPTLVTANGLTGAHLARLLDRAADGFDLQVPVRAVGHTARLYEQLYGPRGATATDGGSETLGDAPPDGVETARPTDSGVACVPVFDGPGTCLGPGEITVAGPDVPTEQSSGTLFETLANNPNACVYQVIGSGRTPREDADCTLYTTELANHPPPAALETLVDTLAPRHTVIAHERGASGKYNYLDSMVWAGDNDEVFELYDGHSWQMPPWTHQSVLRTDATDGYQGTVPETLPAPRGGRVDLPREGVDVEALSDRLHTSYDPDRVSDTGSTGASVDDPTAEGSPEVDGLADTDGADDDGAARDENVGSVDEPGDRVDTASETVEERVDTDERGESQTHGPSQAHEHESGTHEPRQSGTHERAATAAEHTSVSPVAVGLARQAAARRGVSVETAVTEAVEGYLESLLRGTADGTNQEAVALDATVSDGLRAALAGPETDTDPSAVVETVLGTALAPDTTGETLPLPDAGFVGDGVAAVVDNPEFELDTPGAVVEAAICRHTAHAGTT